MVINSLDREYILNELRVLKSELRDRYQVSKIGIFGSVARNEATERRDRPASAVKPYSRRFNPDRRWVTGNCAIGSSRI